MTSLRMTFTGPVAAAMLGTLALAAPCFGGDVLDNRSVVSDLSGLAGSARYYRVLVPAGTSLLEVGLSGGQGDSDLYISRQVRPTTKYYQARGIGPTNDERIRVSRPQADWWHVLVYGAGNYAGAKLHVRYEAPGASDQTVTPLTNNVAQFPLSGPKGAGGYFQITVPPLVRELTITTDGGEGDADVYVDYQSLPTQQRHQYRSAGPTNSEQIVIPRPTAGVWYVLVYGAGPFGDVKLVAAFGQAGPPHRPQTAVAITSPTRNVAWRIGGAYAITWRATRDIRYVQLEFSRDNGQSWTRANLPAKIDANDGRYVWTVPFDFRNFVSSMARIRITGITRQGRPVSAMSEAFSVVPVLMPGPDSPPVIEPPPPQVLGKPRRDQYEPDVGPETAKELRFGEIQTHSIYPEKDRDWVVVRTIRPGRHIVRFTDITKELKVELWTPQQDGKLKSQGKFRYKRTGALQVDAPQGMPYFMLKIECDDEDDEGWYRVSLHRD